MFPKIPTNPGVYKDDTPLEAEGYFTTVDKVRFVRGLPQSFAGWELVTNTTLTGKCRGIHTWADSDVVKWAAFGTHTNLYSLTDAVVYDITPIVARGQLTNPFSTTDLSTTVTVAHNAHGRAVGDRVNFSGASAVGGITVSGNYTVVTAAANSYTITHATPATSTAGPGGGTVNYKYSLAIGLADSIGALGYGVGVWSNGLYSNVATGDVFCRTWSMGNIGPNLLACPRGGKIWEFHPAITAPELVTNGSFATDTDWTKGSGWTISAGAAHCTTVTSTGLTQTILCEPMSYFILECDATLTDGTLQISIGSTDIGAAIDASGNVQRTVYGGNSGGSLSLAFTGVGFKGSLANVTFKQLLTAEAMTNAPTQNTCVVVTPDNFVMACGTVEINTGNFNPLHIRWSDIAPNHHTWTPSGTNQSRFWTLGIGSRIVAAKVAGNDILIWTDKILYVARFTNNSNTVYTFRAIEGSAGLIGAQAAAVLSGIAYWKSPDGVNYRYAGGTAQAMQSTIQRDVFDNLAYAQNDKIFASTINAWQNVIWFYADKRDGTNEISRYELLCAQEPAPRQGGGPLGLGVWADGIWDRTSWIDSSEGVFQYPISVSADGAVNYQEKGDSANGGNINWKMRRAGIKLGDGRNLWMMSQFVPDFESLIGGCSLTAYSYLWMQSDPVAHGPFMVTSATQTVDMLSDAPVGRLVVLEFEANASPCFMRDGYHCMDAQDTGMAF